MKTGTCIIVVTVCITLASAIASAQEGNVSFQTLTAEETGIKAIIDKWKAEELERQGGKFGSHGWWPWGLNVFDYDKDGDLDLLLTQHGVPRGIIVKSLLKETGKFRFVNATAELGLDSRQLPISDGRPRIWDFDGDGWLDIGGFSDEHKVTSFFNQAGKKFVLADFSFQPTSYASEVLDLDGDGHPDVKHRLRRRSDVIGEWIYQPKSRTFKNRAVPQPLHARTPDAIKQAIDQLVKEKKLRFVRIRYHTEHDLNADGRKDFVVAFYASYSSVAFARYLIAGPDGKLTDRTAELGLPPDRAPILIRDLTGDGAPDVLTSAGPNAGLHLSDGRGKFSLKPGRLTDFVKGKEPYSKRVYPVDFDNDGDIDLVVTKPRYGDERVFENLGEGVFRQVLRARGWVEPVAVCDLDGDGLMDVVIGTTGKDKSTEVTLYLNRTAKAGHYCKLYPRMDAPNPYAVGTLVEVFRPGELGKPGAKPFLVEKAHPDATPVHVGLGNETHFDLRVTFPAKPPLELRNVETAPHIEIRPDGRLTR